MEALIERARIRNVHTLISHGTEVDNPPSVYLHLKHGFRKVGVLKEVGCKHGTYIDRLLMEKILMAPDRNDTRCEHVRSKVLSDFTRGQYYTSRLTARRAGVSLVLPCSPNTTSGAHGCRTASPT